MKNSARLLIHFVLFRIIRVLPVICLLAVIDPLQGAEFSCSSGDVTCLIAAISEANGNGEENTISLEAGTYILTAVDNNSTKTDGPNGLPSVISPLSIIGADASSTVIKRDAGAPAFRIIHVSPPGVLRIEGLSIMGGNAPFASGGGVFNKPGTISTGVGTVNIFNSIIADNEAGVGGGIENDGSMTIDSSTIARNRGGGINTFGGPLDITNSLIVSNDGIGIGVTAAKVNITSSTIAYNTSNFTGGGVSNSPLDQVGGRMTIVNSTIAHNSAAKAGGISNESLKTTTTIQNSIVALNTASDSGPDCINSPFPVGGAGGLISLGNNVVGDPSDCGINLLSNDLTGDPGLGDFTDNGTPGNGHFPVLAGSQVIDAGNADACPPTDQLGSPRVGTCDIGSVEFSGLIQVVIDVRPRTDTDRINPSSDKTINVAIFSAKGFDATLIDPDTVRFGATGSEAAPVHVGRRDVNGDGQRDLVLRFEIPNLGVTCGTTSVTLTGQLSDGESIIGSSPITTSGCKTRKTN